MFRWQRLYQFSALPMYLKPTSTHIIPVHPSTDGWEKQKLVVDRHEYPAVKTANKKIAFIFSHSNGFHKEAFHPLMKRFIDQLRQRAEYDQTHITFIAWDARNHGDSARLNDGTFEESYRWFDNCMDTKQVIEEMGLDEEYDHLFGVGHSFGATSMILLEFFYPGTFSGLQVTEPVMNRVMFDGAIRDQIPILASRKRRDEWPSREECYKSLVSKGFFKLLHPEVLANYVQYGMYDTEQGTIKLKCPREQEYHVFRHSAYDTYTAQKSLQLLKIPVHFVYALGSSFIAPDEAATVIDENKSQITLDFVEGTHMVPNEKPGSIIPHIFKLIDRVNKVGSSVKSKL